MQTGYAPPNRYVPKVGCHRGDVRRPGGGNSVGPFKYLRRLNLKRFAEGLSKWSREAFQICSCIAGSCFLLPFAFFRQQVSRGVSV